MTTSPLEALKQHFGYDGFRDNQEAIIHSVLEKNDLLTIMPTGGGKSICYQLPALLFPSLTIVVSPLIALMQDQVDALTTNGINAAALNSMTSTSDETQIWQNIREKTLKLLYISPERATSQSFIQAISNEPVDLVAIDEAHCVSIWGNDFRQEYTRLTQLLNKIPGACRIALTATADKATQEDIVQILELRESKQYISSFERKNLNINVLPAQNRVKTIIDFVKSHSNDVGIVYCLSRKGTEKLSSKLIEAGIPAGFYHADLSPEVRKKVQRDFQEDKIKVICATIAFGMGIDKSNVRYVIHHNLPKNIESYYQEIGRAGRDGLKSTTMLFFSLGDAKILRQFIDDSQAEESFKMVQRTKLNRMIEFGQSRSCRTNVILSYFGEYRTDGCGHCDNCLNPPKLFDGTVLAQKILSATKRLNEGVSTQILVDVLRGSDRQEILRAGYNRIKTYGAISDVSRDDLLQYIAQLINQGVLSIDFTDYNKLKVTEVGTKVLFEDHKIDLAKPVEIQKGTDTQKKTDSFESALFERLRSLRLTLAKQQNVPAYAVFNDATLQEMVRVRPLFEKDFAAINGVGEHKLKNYGEEFLEAIKKFSNEQTILKKVKGQTYLETHQLIQSGLSPQAIAEKRELSIDTIFQHIAYLFDQGNLLDLSPYISEEEINMVTPQWYKFKRTTKTSEIHQALDGSLSHGKIKLAISFLQKG